MKRYISFLLTLFIALSASACSGKDNSNILTLTDGMTDTERQRVTVGELTVFEHEQVTMPNDGVYLEIWSPEYEKEYWTRFLENNPDVFESNPDLREDIQALIESINSDDTDRVYAAFCDGVQVFVSLPDPYYDGGELSYVGQDGTEIVLKGFEEIKPVIQEEAEQLEKNGVIEKGSAEAEYERAIRVWEAIIGRNYKTLEAGTAEKYNADSSLAWEFDRAATEDIAPFVREISIYDEELDANFIVHVTLPPDFDEEKTYPAYVLTDGVWRFGNCPALRKAMEEDRAGDALLVTIGYDYSIDGMDNANRSHFFFENCGKFLDFITDNLMPFLGEQYCIDFNNSMLYGHSAGGVFTHYAAFNSDKYENQPFGIYIIGSPAFWSPYFLPCDGFEEYKTEYGYFDRNNTLDKRLFICAGENEDADYAEYYGENDSTLEGVENLTKRLSDYGFTDFECKIYPDSGHWQFIPQMLEEVLEKYCPAGE